MVSIAAFFLMIIIFLKIGKLFLFKKYDDIPFFLFKCSIASSIFLSLGYFYYNGSLHIPYEQFFMILFLIFGSIQYVLNLKECLRINHFLMAISLISVILVGLNYLYIQRNIVDVYIIGNNTGIDEVYFNQSLLQFPSINSGVNNSIKMLLLFIIFTIIGNKYFRIPRYIFEMKKFLIKIYHFMFIIITIEFLIQNLFQINSVREFINNIFGVHSFTYLEAPVRFGIISSFGTFKEPSHLASAMLIYYLLIFSEDFTIKKNRVFYLYSFMILFLSGSTTAVSIIPFGLVIGCLINSKGFKFKITIPKIIVGFIFAIIGVLIGYIYYDKFNKLFIEIMDKISNIVSTTSNNGTQDGKARSYSIKLAYNAFINNPLFGIGYGVTRATGFLSSILSNLGVIGSIIYIVFLSNLMNLKITKNTLLILIILIIYLNYSFQLATMYQPIILSLFLFLNRHIIKERGI